MSADVLYYEKRWAADGTYQYVGITMEQVMQQVRISWWKMLWQLITLS